MRFFIQLLLLILLLVALGCDLPHEPGPMPKHIIDTDYVESLNIMGILRLDDEADLSFIHVQRTMTTKEIYTFEADPVIKNATVTLTDQDSVGQWFFQHSYDTLYNGYYYENTFAPVVGHTYNLEIEAESLPILTATTTVPQKPQLEDYTIDYQSKTAVFELLVTPDTYQYNLFLVFQEEVLETKVEGDLETVKTVMFNWNVAVGDPLKLMITGLDENLTSYGNSSISFIPNTFHEDGSTVTGGFGCLGSVAVTTIKLE